MYQFEQLISESTRVTETSATFIDLAFSNQPEKIIKSGVEHVGISEHNLIFILRKISLPHKEPKIINTRQLKNYDINALRTDLGNILQTQSSEMDTNKAWDEWKTKFLLVVEMHAPHITQKVRSEYTPWITNNIKKKMYHRDHLKEIAVKTGSKLAHEAHKRARNETNKLVKNTKAICFMNALKRIENNPKKMWNTINKFTNRKYKTKNVKEVRHDDEAINEPCKIANTFNKFFNEIGTNLANNFPAGLTSPESNIKPSNSRFQIHNVSEIYV